MMQDPAQIPLPALSVRSPVGAPVATSDTPDNESDPSATTFATLLDLPAASDAAPTRGNGDTSTPRPQDTERTKSPAPALLSGLPVPPHGIDLIPVPAPATPVPRLTGTPSLAPLQPALLRVPQMPGLRPGDASVNSAPLPSIAGTASPQDTRQAPPLPLSTTEPPSQGVRLPPILRGASPGIIPPDGLPMPAAALGVAIDTGTSPPLPPVLLRVPQTQFAPAASLAGSTPVVVSADAMQPNGSLTGTLTVADAALKEVLSALQPVHADSGAAQALGSVASSDTAIPPFALHPLPQSANAMPAAPSPVAVLPQPASPETGYGDALGDHLAWMAAQKLSHAQLRVSPEHLGPIDIRIQLDGREVRAEFHSPHAEVRQTLEASLPRLRELLGQQGLQLTHAGVGQGQSQTPGRQRAEEWVFAGPSAFNGDEGAAPSQPGLPESRRPRGLLDEYA
ncbi:MAG: flagellar hook-length control protein FliK [Thermomonas hydrothermalis]|uniref:flagellar hook-length control protein FliK n=1 Tax=Thermomonas hydrothermalis TaxID=213588 RepID=UPI00235776BD|nr:flagellar hook-length control protein FliK [Thermomonas hydrothermalis]MCL6618461.1 flagellar hook-length control protein FliK [Thermomonas hydrothermalis]